MKKAAALHFNAIPQLTAFIVTWHAQLESGKSLKNTWSTQFKASWITAWSTLPSSPLCWGMTWGFQSRWVEWRHTCHVCGWQVAFPPVEIKTVLCASTDASVFQVYHRKAWGPHPLLFHCHFHCCCRCRSHCCSLCRSVLQEWVLKKKSKNHQLTLSAIKNYMCTLVNCFWPSLRCGRWGWGGVGGYKLCSDDNSQESAHQLIRFSFHKTWRKWKKYGSWAEHQTFSSNLLATTPSSYPLCEMRTHGSTLCTAR